MCTHVYKRRTIHAWARARTRLRESERVEHEDIEHAQGAWGMGAVRRAAHWLASSTCETMPSIDSNWRCQLG